MNPNQSRRLVVGATLLLAGVAAATASYADTLNLVRRDGTKVPLTRSSTEVGVTFADVNKAAVAGRGLLAGHGRVESFPGAPYARIKLMHVGDAATAKRTLPRAATGLEEVRSVYRVAGTAAPLVSTGTINVRLRPGLNDAEREQIWKAYRVRLIGPVDGLKNTYNVAPVAGGDDDDVPTAELLTGDARVAWAQPNFRSPPRPRQVSVSDAYYPRQWHLNNGGQAGGVSDADIDAPEAWAIAAGQDVLIGMFDDSCDVDHEDLRDGFSGTGHDPSVPSNQTEDFEDPRPKQAGDVHGTAVMGLAAARGNSIGVRGVAFLARFTASRGLGNLLTDAQIASAYTFARQQDVDVHINSWGLDFGALTPAILEDAIEAAFREGRDLDGEAGRELPRGMVVVFASGNGINGEGPGVRVTAGRELATLPTVIGVGASNVFDQITEYSDFGPEIDVLAPGGDGEGLIVTTDNSDNLGYVDSGSNLGGFDPFGNPDFDPTGAYFGGFAGTSAACPIVGGVAALMLSVNPRLTATDVRLILEHTCDKISPDDASYHSVTARSVRYGYGRVNAHTAAVASQQSLTNGGRSWPERVADVRITDTQLTWLQNGDPLEFQPPPEDDDDETENPPAPLRTTDDFLVVESASPFSFLSTDFPVDGRCYSREQLGCEDANVIELSPLPEGVAITAVGCPLSCASTAAAGCTAGTRHCVPVTAGGTRYYGVYARSAIGRYSFGVSVDTDGNILDPGALPPTAADVPTDGGSSGGGTIPTSGPKLTITTSATRGQSPLTVSFMGNAISEAGIDETRTTWDFDIDDAVPVNATTRNAQYTYIVPSGEMRTYIARLTMYDVNGNSGSAQISIEVEGPGSTGGGTTGGSGLRITVGIPGTVGSDVEGGKSPFTVQLSVDTSGLLGTLQSIRWDLGDGTTASTLFVSHTYVNTTDSILVLPITVTVTSLTAGSTTVTTTASRTVTIEPGSGAPAADPPPLDGTGAIPGQGGGAAACGALGMLPVFLLLVGLSLLRRGRR
ncbi:MAG: S8 family serine peptidase [Planctomycetes bacterium]|nr:S8 family serine peptidase [Planctomycetota bacterium]